MNDKWIKEEYINKALKYHKENNCTNCPYNHPADRNDKEYINQSFKEIYCDMIKEMININQFAEDM